jgi:hypothetical protein
MGRRLTAIMTIVWGGACISCGAAQDQGHPPASLLCRQGSIEERLACLSAELDRQHLEILRLKWQLENFSTPKITPLAGD